MMKERRANFQLNHIQDMFYLKSRVYPILLKRNEWMKNEQNQIMIEAMP